MDSRDDGLSHELFRRKPQVAYTRTHVDAYAVGIGFGNEVEARLDDRTVAPLNLLERDFCCPVSAVLFPTRSIDSPDAGTDHESPSGQQSQDASRDEVLGM